MFEVNVHSTRGFGFSVSDGKTFLEHLTAPHYRFFQVAAGGGAVPVQTLNQWHSNALAIPESRLSRIPEGH